MLIKVAGILGYFISGLASIITLFLLLKNKSGSRGIGDIVITVFVFLWILSPYLTMVCILTKHFKLPSTRLIADCIVTMLISFMGLYMIVNVFYFSKDPQSPIVIFFIPIFQLFVCGFLLIYYAIKDNP